MQLLLEHKEVTVQELIGKLEVTGKTIREDLAKLEDKGLLHRMHGGARLAQKDHLGLLSPAAQVPHAEERADIARRAASYIRPGDIVALDGGRTTLAIARLLTDMPPLTVITNDLLIVNELTPHEQIRLVVPGGYRIRNMLTGPEAVGFIQNLNIGKAFLSATSVHPESGFSVYTSDFLDYKRALLSTAEVSYVVADHHKFGTNALRTFASLSEVQAIITDNGLSTDAAAVYRDKGIKVDNGQES